MPESRATAPSLSDPFADHPGRIADLPRQDIARRLEPLVARLESLRSAGEGRADVEAALGLARRLFLNGRSADALPLARAALARAHALGDRTLARRSATACGLLSSDSADIVGGIGYHVEALRISAADDDAVEMSRTWNNIGMALGVGGSHELATRCYQRALALVEDREEPIFSRFAACANLADSLFHTGQYDEGLVYGSRALMEETPDFRELDDYGTLVVRYNMVRLLVTRGRIAEAEGALAELVRLSADATAPRTRITVAIARALHEMATGRTDLALTRLDQALVLAREVPASMRDTLTAMVRAEELAGHPDRALLRLQELSEHVYRDAVARARDHLEIGALPAWVHAQGREEQARARLVSRLEPAHPPESWGALQRLALSAALRIEPSGRHGVRVGALAKALATEAGLASLKALEVGLAAELHDIGMTSVPEVILRKREPLTEGERAVIRRHAEAGAEILGDDGHPRVLMAREMARYHHARWDGNGYPERIGGRQIPEPARMCAIADAYDAMVVGLAGRAPRTMEEALDELGREAGRQFDPALVTRFDRMVRNQSQDLGMDLGAADGSGDFDELINALQEDGGFV